MDIAYTYSTILLYSVGRESGVEEKILEMSVFC